MKNLLASFFIVCFLAVTGCATFEKAKRVDELEAQVGSLKSELQTEQQAKDDLQQSAAQANAKVAELQAVLEQREKTVAEQQQMIQKLETERQEMNSLLEQRQQGQPEQQVQ